MAMTAMSAALQCSAACVPDLAQGRLKLRRTFPRLVLLPPSSCGRVKCSLRTETQVQVQALWSWAQAQGVQGEAVQPLETAAAEGQGLGLVAQRQVNPGEEVVTVPEALWINIAAVEASSLGRFCKELKPWIAISLFLVHERANLSSKWRPYLDSLPRALDSPLFWSDEELEELQGTQLLGSVAGYFEYLENEFNKLREEVLEREAGVFDSEVFTFEAFRWAFGILRSRTFAPLIGDELALVPVADLVNHGAGLSDESPSWVKKRTGQIWNLGKDSAQVLALRVPAGFQPGEQVLMQYGSEKSNAELALDYGFVEREPGGGAQFVGGGGGASNRDSLALTLEISPDDRFVDDKVDILELNGLQCSMQFDLSRGQGPPDAMITFLRLSALSGQDAFLLEALFRNDAWGHLSLPVSRDNEEAVCASMLDGLQAALAGYRTTIEDDMELLNRGGLTARAEIAIVVRLGEKRVLEELQTWFEARQAGLDSLEYYAERRLRDLGLLDDKGYMTPWVFNE